MAPEQLRGLPADARTDIWALGVMLYEMAARRRPFDGRTWAELSASIIAHPPLPLPSTVPNDLQLVIQRCLEKDPGRRYATAAEIGVALEVSSTAATAEKEGVRSRRKPVLPAAVVMAVIAVVGLGWGVTKWRKQHLAVPTRSLAVLPLINAGNDAGIEYLCDGLTESLIRHVSRLGEVKVTPSSAVFSLKPGLSAVEAGRLLGVESVLAGTVARQAGRLTIAVELVDVTRSVRLWSRKYDRPITDVIRLQEEIAGAIVSEGLQLHPISDERVQFVRHVTNDPEAYDLYLQGRFLQRRATGDDYFRVRELMQRAIVRDPGFADAYVLLGGTYAMMALDGLERPTDAWPQSNRYMRKGMELDPSLMGAHALAHAQAVFFDWDWAAGERERKIMMQARAGDIDPTMLRALALECWAVGQLDEALLIARRMRELDRLSPDLISLHADYLVKAGRFEEAKPLYEKAIRDDPSDPNPYFGLAESLRRQRRFEEAIEVRRKAHAAAGDVSLDDLLARARGEAGYQQIDRAWVREQLEALTARAAVEYVSPLDFARAHAQLGDAAQAFFHLDAAFADRSPGLVFLKVDRAWDPVRDDPRFMVAVGRVGLP
ncbi:MAG: tetratricopeptide repeat protein, partial [Thermoanaerobaculia bacterium]